MGVQLVWGAQQICWVLFPFQITSLLFQVSWYTSDYVGLLPHRLGIRRTKQVFYSKWKRVRVNWFHILWILLHFSQQDQHSHSQSLPLFIFQVMQAFKLIWSIEIWNFFWFLPYLKIKSKIYLMINPNQGTILVLWWDLGLEYFIPENIISDSFNHSVHSNKYSLFQAK